MPRRALRQWLLNGLTAGAVLAALAVVWTDRIAPAVSDDGAVAVGGEVASKMSLLRVPANEPVAPRDIATSLLVVFQSTCAVCDRVSPEWSKLAERAPGRVFAVGLEEDASAATWIRRVVPGAVHVRPAVRSKFVESLGLRAVPTTILLDGGELALRHIGPLGPDEFALLLATLAPDHETRTMGR